MAWGDRNGLPRVLRSGDLEVRLGGSLGPYAPGHYLKGRWVGAAGFIRPVSVRLVPRSQAQFWTRSLVAMGERRHGAYPEVYWLDEWRGYRVAVGEPLDGRSLTRRLALRRPLSTRWREALDWQLAGTLAWAHAAGLAHGNLGPEQVWLTREGYLKLLDWGLMAGSPASDCRAYIQLLERLGLPVPTVGLSMAARVGDLERRLRRAWVYEPLP